MGPWSPVGQRFDGFNNTHDVIDTANEIAYEPYATSYPVSVMSIDSSSPQPPGMSTPSSTRSPSFAEARLHSTSPHSVGVGSFGSMGYMQDQDQTPRVPQHNFSQPMRSSLSYHLTGTGAGTSMGTSSQQTIKRKRNDHFQREPSRSPFSSSSTSSYVLVDKPKSASKDKMLIDSKPSIAQTSSFVIQQEYPQGDEKRPRKASECGVRKPSNGKKSGGRSLGMHLDAKKAAKAKDLRSDGACWICCLQRDSVSLFSKLIRYSY